MSDFGSVAGPGTNIIDAVYPVVSHWKRILSAAHCQHAQDNCAKRIAPRGFTLQRAARLTSKLGAGFNQAVYDGRRRAFRTVAHARHVGGVGTSNILDACLNALLLCHFARRAETERVACRLGALLADWNEAGDKS
jgi:hypothetical protein